MKNLNNSNLRLGIQKNGRLTQDSINLLQKAELNIDYALERLHSSYPDLSLDIFYLRNEDIGRYVEAGVIDIGIVGQNLLYEAGYKVEKLLKLNFGFCRFSLAVPQNSCITKIEQLANKRVATSYPISTQQFFDRSSIPIEVVSLRGSIEIAPALDLSEAITDLVSTGRTIAINALRVISTIYESQAVLIANSQVKYNQSKSAILQELLYRISSALSFEKLLL